MPVLASYNCGDGQIYYCDMFTAGLCIVSPTDINPLHIEKGVEFLEEEIQKYYPKIINIQQLF